MIEWMKSTWAKLTSPAALKKEAQILSLVATVSTNPATKAEIAVAAKAVGVIADNVVESTPEK